jgi:hypothetical protein
MHFSVTNVTDQTVRATFEDGKMGFVLTAADRTAYDSRHNAQHALSVPFVLPTKIPPNHSFSPASDDVRVRWGGPLTLTPECLGTALPPLQANVSAIGAAVTDTQAIDAVAAASGGLLDSCRPAESGVPVDGKIEPPLGSTPAMPATCSITLQDQGGFSSARIVIIAPTGLSGVSVRPPYEDQVLGISRHQDAEAVTWDFVVTSAGAIPVYSYVSAQWPQGSALAESEFEWTGSRWILDGKGGACGSHAQGAPYGTGGGGSEAGADVPIVWRCP